MKFKSIIISATILGSITTSIAIDNNVSIKLKEVDKTKNTKENLSYIISSNKNDINKDLIDGYENTKQWYFAIDANGIAGTLNSKSGAGANFTIGHEINKYFSIQYNQLVGKIFAGLGESIIEFKNNTILTPYAIGGAGWANLSGKVTGAWNVGTGIKVKISKNIETGINYRYIQTIASNSISGVNGRASTNIIGTGLTWFFGGNENTNISSIKNTNIIKALREIDKEKSTNKSIYKLQLSNIKQCDAIDMNNIKNDVCYKVIKDNTKIYLDTKFDYDTVTLNDQSKIAISTFVKFIKDNDITSSIIIKGYASKGRIGDRFSIYNQKLSEKRAVAVANYIKELSFFDNEKIITKGFGYDHNLKGIPKSDSRNQRVEATISVVTN